MATTNHFAGYDWAAAKALETGKIVYASATRTMMGGNMKQVPKLSYTPWKRGGQWVVSPNGNCEYRAAR